jgi:predicted  nucleic acid-binding Zn-ribbon protein
MSFKQELESARTPDRPVADSALFAGAQSIIREQEDTIAELHDRIARLLDENHAQEGTITELRKRLESQYHANYAKAAELRAELHKLRQEYAESRIEVARLRGQLKPAAYDWQGSHDYLR